MRRFVLMTFGLLAAGVLTKTDLRACGDKLLIGGRGVRYQLIHSGVTGSILLYRNVKLPKESRMRDPKLPAALKDVGHKVTIATDPEQFGSDLKSRKYDLVIADASDVPLVKDQVQSSPSKPLLISLDFSDTKLKEAEYTKYVEQALKSRRK